MVQSVIVKLLRKCFETSYQKSRIVRDNTHFENSPTVVCYEIVELVRLKVAKKDAKEWQGFPRTMKAIWTNDPRQIRAP